MIAASLLNPMRDALRKISDRTFKDSKRSHDLKRLRNQEPGLPKQKKNLEEYWPNYVRDPLQKGSCLLFNRDADPLAATHLSAKARTA